MESPRTTLALGPFEVSFRRREDAARLGVLASIVLHLIVVALLMWAPRPQRAAEQAAAKAAMAPVPITFVDPLPPPPKPKVDEFSQKPPLRSAPKPLRMEPVPESTSVARNLSSTKPGDQAGRRDTKPAGGEEGGPKPQPTPGVPPPAPSGSESATSDTVASAAEPPPDILGRLRDFKRAVEAPRPSNPNGPEGGGHGRGGVSMPNLPDTGFGVGNLEFEGRDYDWDDYGRQIHGIIWRAWHNRLLITSSVFERWAGEHRSWMLDHRNGVRFTILRTGQVVDVAIETPSGCYPLDDSATDTLKEVVLPPLPQDFQRDTETVHARFIAEGDIREMHSFLRQMKNAGYF